MSAPLCSVQAAEAGVPLIGTAGTYSVVVAVELASPWAPKLKGSAASDAHVDSALERLDRRCKGLRVLFFDGDGRSEDGQHRVLIFERPPGPFRGFARRCAAAPREHLAALIDSIEVGEGADADAHEPGQDGRDVFVCTHGSRDACCGKLGFPLFRQLGERLAAPGVRVWRCSHLGGHRFAPTLLDMPSGRVYGRVRGEDADWLRTGDFGPALLEQHYRGLCVLPEPVQVAERQMWLRQGPRWADAAIEWAVEHDGDATRVSLAGLWSDGHVERAHAELIETREDELVIAESCGRDPKRQKLWKLTSWSESAA